MLFDLVLTLSIFNPFFVRIGDLDAHSGFSCTLIILRWVLGDLQQILRQSLVFRGKWGQICFLKMILFIRCLFFVSRQLFCWKIRLCIFSDDIFSILMRSLIFHRLAKLRLLATLGRHYPLFSINSDDCAALLVFQIKSEDDILLIMSLSIKDKIFDLLCCLLLLDLSFLSSLTPFFVLGFLLLENTFWNWLQSFN